MKRRFLAFVCCFSMLVSLLPCSAKANGKTTNVNLLDTPVEVAEVFYRQNASLRKNKEVTAQDQQNEIRKRVIVESAQKLENTYVGERHKSSGLSGRKRSKHQYDATLCQSMEKPESSR